MSGTLILGITKHGVAIGRRLRDALPGSELHVPEKFASAAGAGAVVYTKALTVHLADVFPRYEYLVCVVSLGAVVRMIAPLLKDKHTDPGVVVVDDAAKFSISVLSGHVGGANALAQKVAAVLGATAVITTASDVGKTVPVDILGRELGWTTELDEHITAISAHVVNEEPVAFVQETGEPNWWTRDVPLPKSIRTFATVDEFDPAAFRAVLLVTDRDLSCFPGAVTGKAVVYRPRSLVVGIGCDRGTPCARLEEGLRKVLADARLSPRCIRNLATISLKADEEGLLDLCRKNAWRLDTYTPDQINAIRDRVPNPSETVLKFTGAVGAAEPAALLSSGAERLLVEKVKLPQMTVAVARVPF